MLNGKKTLFYASTVVLNKMIIIVVVVVVVRLFIFFFIIFFSLYLFPDIKYVLLIKRNKNAKKRNKM